MRATHIPAAHVPTGERGKPRSYAGAWSAVSETLVRGLAHALSNRIATIGTIAEARKAGFSPTFLGTSASYTDLIHKLGGKAMDGLYATMTVQNPYVDAASKQIILWANKYKTQFHAEQTGFSI